MLLSAHKMEGQACHSGDCFVPIGGLLNLSTGFNNQTNSLYPANAKDEYWTASSSEIQIPNLGVDMVLKSRVIGGTSIVGSTNSQIISYGNGTNPNSVHGTFIMAPVLGLFNTLATNGKRINFTRTFNVCATAVVNLNAEFRTELDVRSVSLSRWASGGNVVLAQSNGGTFQTCNLNANKSSNANFDNGNYNPNYQVKNNLNIDLSVYPNPTTGAITFNSNILLNSLKVEILNMQGQVVFTTEVNKVFNKEVAFDSNTKLMLSFTVKE